MLTIETEVDIAADGTLLAHAPPHAPKGRHHVVIVIDTAEAVAPEGPLPDFRAFRASLAGKPYPGTSVADYRAEERA